MELEEKRWKNTISQIVTPNSEGPPMNRASSQSKHKNNSYITKLDTLSTPFEVYIKKRGSNNLSYSNSRINQSRRKYNAHRHSYDSLVSQSIEKEDYRQKRLSIITDISHKKTQLELGSIPKKFLKYSSNSRKRILISKKQRKQKSKFNVKALNLKASLGCPEDMKMSNEGNPWCSMVGYHGERSEMSCDWRRGKNWRKEQKGKKEFMNSIIFQNNYFKNVNEEVVTTIKVNLKNQKFNSTKA
ncbi:unnamed protein product [Moneuplotes crassus]|uniref:Uncharacterized protein n=1 Tax=Euplotes crassus TaxID=5936 RepID=A0AAD1ULL3_EUPCR|nr:unnamed protein product [Moneuplotes crassus]